MAVLTNVGLCDRDSNNFRFTVTKNFYEKLKRVEGGGKRPLRISTLVKTAHQSHCYMLSPLALPCLPNDEVVFTMMSSAFVCKVANLHSSVIFFSSIMTPNQRQIK